ncbi:cytochrome c-type biogenesis protein CcmH [Saccharopolyspora indica]|uniref:cytochrome c-type biogenesis protein n=1 Tax=Saccharopolyspora indica TaxID=1229659 RepID=UPI0022EAF14E|nr:cytochrome c-type biogenesis protein [Saccharopolyspora indica]MDA3644078.1 cytochrome c-type biogenesis protein CcmH [Saccharopolyspora indica]
MRHRISQAALAALILGLLAFTGVVLVTGPPAPVDRAYELERGLRCPVCQSVSVAESMSDTAEAMRRSVREQVAAGRSDEEIVDYFRARYGDWVVLDPPVAGSTVALWLVPGAVGLAGALIVLLRPRSRGGTRVELTDDDRARVQAELRRVRVGEETR